MHELVHHHEVEPLLRGHGLVLETECVLEAGGDVRDKVLVRFRVIDEAEVVGLPLEKLGVDAVRGRQEKEERFDMTVHLKTGADPATGCKRRAEHSTGRNGRVRCWREEWKDQVE